MFWTVGNEMPRALAISPPFFPSLTIFFTLARVSSVMRARFLRRPLRVTPCMMAEQ